MSCLGDIPYKRQTYNPVQNFCLYRCKEGRTFDTGVNYVYACTGKPSGTSTVKNALVKSIELKQRDSYAAVWLPVRHPTLRLDERIKIIFLFQ